MRFILGALLVITILTAGTAWANPSVVGGNVIVDRQLVDVYQNFYLLDTNHPFEADGQLTHWEIFAENANPVQLVIYRQLEGEFSVVGRSAVETPRVGYNLFDLDHQIKVKAGDFVGVFHPQKGSVSFTLDPPSLFDFGNLTGTVLFTYRNAGLGGATNFIGSSNRRYSIRAFQQGS
jgi:hypothetical protein